jgi:hypothetical protein
MRVRGGAEWGGRGERESSGLHGRFYLYFDISYMLMCQEIY